MRRAVILCSALALWSAAVTHAKLPPPTEAEIAKARAAKAKADELAKKQAAALAKAQDRVVAHYKRSKDGATAAVAPVKAGGTKVAKKTGKVERLTCLSGSEDRHARIGVELVDKKVVSFAYYSKWKPRTCSIEVARNGPYSRWEDTGTTSRVVLMEQKGVLQIDHKASAYRFIFRDVDRMRYCGMDGRINGTLTVTRGKSQCEVQGVMDGHSS
jgi:hypothetical protein